MIRNINNTVHGNYWLLCFLWALASVSCAKAQSETPSPKITALNILTYNIHHANPSAHPDKIDLAAIARVINDSDADLVALQEVDVHTARSGVAVDQASELAKLTNRRVFFVKTLDYDGGEYGIAVLSRFPIEEQKGVLLPNADSDPGEQRAMAVIQVQVDNRPIYFASSHWGLTAASRKLQSGFIVDYFKNMEAPVIIAGDFNAVPQSEEIIVLDRLFYRSRTNQGFTIPVGVPKKEIDYIAYTPKNIFEVLNHVVVQEHEASDHLPVLVKLKLQ